MRIAIGLAVVLLVTILAGFFALVAITIHSDFRERFARLAVRLEHEAFAIVRQILRRG